MHEIRQKTFGYILAGFGFVAGLAWNDAIKSFIDYLFPAPSDVLLSKFVYAFAVTLIAVFMGMYFLNGSDKETKK